MRFEQEIADLFPGTFTSGPWSKKLNRVAIGLRPSATRLQCLVESPSQIFSSRMVQQRTPFIETFHTGTAVHRFIPKSFPAIEALAATSVNIDGPSNPVMAEDTWFEKDADRISDTVFNIRCKSFEHSFQLSRKV
jgi:hypothetical protein